MGPRSRRFFFLGMALGAAALLGGCIPTTGDPSISLPYADDFSGDCRWPEANEPAFVADCVDGAYELTARNGDDVPGGTWVRLQEATPALAVEARADVEKGGPGAADDFLYGVSCISDGEAVHDYSFVVEGGDWAILRSSGENTTRTVLREGRAPSASRGAPLIRAVCVAAPDGATVLALELDGERVAAVTEEIGYESFEGIGLALELADDDARGATVRFDDVRATLPGGSEVEAARADAAVLFEDDFSDPESGWATRRDKDAVLAYERGGYRVLAKSAEPNWSLIPVAPASDAILVEADATYVGGPATVGYGVVCYAEADEEDGYIFTVSPSGGYAIFRETHDDVRVVADGSGDFTGTARPLNLRAACVGGPDGTELTLFVDGREVAVVEDEEDGVRRFGIVGVYVAGEGGGSDVVFDDFRAEHLGPGGAKAVRDDPPDAESEGPAAGARPGDVLFVETFASERQSWPTGRDATGQLAYRNGAYRVVVTEESAGYDIPQTFSTAADGVRIELDVVQRKPSPGDDDHGVGCVTGDATFLFTIDPEAKRYVLWESDTRSQTELRAGESPSIVGVGGRNRLRADCIRRPDGTELVLSVNGKRIATAVHPGETGPFGGLAITVASGEGGTAVELDEILVRAR